MQNNELSNTITSLVETFNKPSIKLIQQAIKDTKWEANTTWQIDKDDFIKGKKTSYKTDTNLLALAICSFNINAINAIVSLGEVTVCGSLGLPVKDNNLIGAILKFSASEERLDFLVKNETALIELAHRSFMIPIAANHLNEVITQTIELGLYPLLSTIKYYSGHFGIKDSIPEGSPYITGFIDGLLSPDDFNHYTVSRVASRWIEYQLGTITMDEDNINKFYIPILAHWFNGEPLTIDLVMKLAEPSVFNENTFLLLLEKGLLTNSNEYFGRYMSNRPNNSDIIKLLEHMTCKMSASDMKSFIRGCESDVSVITALLSSQLRIYNYIDIERLFLDYARKVDSNFVTILKVAHYMSPLHPFMKILTNPDYYIDIRIEASYRDDILKLDWQEIAKYMKLPNTPALKMDTLTLREKVETTIFSDVLLSPLIMMSLIEQEGLEAVCAVMQRKEWQGVLFTCINPMEVMHILPKRAQKNILSSFT